MDLVVDQIRRLVTLKRLNSRHGVNCLAQATLLLSDSFTLVLEQ